MIGQRFAAVFTLGGLIWGIAVRRVILLLRLSGRFNLFVFRQIEGELIKGLGLGAEAGFLMRRQLPFELLDLVGLCDLISSPIRETKPFSLAGSSGRGLKASSMVEHIPVQPSRGNVKQPNPYILLSYPTFKGRHVFCSMRQSIPSSNIDSCDGLRLTLPSFAAGQTKRPRSRRLVNRQAPC